MAFQDIFFISSALIGVQCERPTRARSQRSNTTYPVALRRQVRPGLHGCPHKPAGRCCEAVNARVVSQHYRQQQRRCVGPPVVENEQPRGCLMQIQFPQRVNSLYRGDLIKLPRLFVDPELHANTMQMQKKKPDADLKALSWQKAPGEPEARWD